MDVSFLLLKISLVKLIRSRMSLYDTHLGILVDHSIRSRMESIRYTFRNPGGSFSLPDLWKITDCFKLENIWLAQVIYSLRKIMDCFNCTNLSEKVTIPQMVRSLKNSDNIFFSKSAFVRISSNEIELCLIRCRIF